MSRTATNVITRGIGLMSVCLLFTGEALARVGGGQGYGGGGGNGGGDGDGGAIIWLIFELIRLLVYLTIEYPVIGIPLDIIVIAAVIWFFVFRKSKSPSTFISATRGLSPGPSFQVQRNPAKACEQLRKFDPNFSEIVFTDFCYTLYGRAHHARGKGSNSLDQLSPYLSERARKSLLQLNSASQPEVQGIIIGSMKVADVRGLDSPLVKISLVFEANYTEVTNGTNEMSYYVRERWELERNRDVLSPTPEQATALHCPRCGAALQQDTTGACAFCSTRIERGEFQWFVKNIIPLDREARGPLLTSDVQEAGTNLPSMVQP
ncbi:MAG: hypothetical protein LC775_19370, partial [Acidobacteria bacterium]|nr:hypothetical protein [Acidobacteriota bacterium]